MSKNDGGSAFPMVSTEYNIAVNEREVNSTGGMTLRDYFAAKALPVWIQATVDASADDLGYEEVAMECYKYADALLAERDRP